MHHYSDVIMSAIAYQITSLTIVYSTIYSGTDQRKHQSSASQAFERGIYRWTVNSSHKGPVTRKMFPFLMTSSWHSAFFAVRRRSRQWQTTSRLSVIQETPWDSCGVVAVMTKWIENPVLPRNGNVFILIFSSLVALEVGKMTTSRAASAENSSKWQYFHFRHTFI